MADTPIGGASFQQGSEPVRPVRHTLLSATHFGPKSGKTLRFMRENTRTVGGISLKGVRNRALPLAFGLQKSGL